MTSSRLRRGVLVTALVSGTAAGLVLSGPASPAHAAVTAPVACPAAFPTADAVDGVTGTGFTVERGTTPEPFTATVLGRITDGILPGVDMIMADLDSPALRRAGGVWRGMSGSPVYSSDGRLIGSVSYGLAESSPIAGITPAEDMKQVLSDPAAAAAAAEGKGTVKVSGAVAARLAKTGDVSAAEAAAGFSRLKVPLVASGAATKKDTFLKALEKRSGTVVSPGGASVPGTASSPAEITAGGNFAAALSYGDFSLTGTGTTTFVCDGEAVAFGHPFSGSGAVQFSAHPADAVYVQADPNYGPFKVANPGGPVGVVDFDGNVGIRAKLGAPVTNSFPVTTSLTVGTKTTTGRTTGVYQYYADIIAANHVYLAAIKALGAESAGSAALTLTVEGVAGGKPFSLVRSDHYADKYDIPYSVADEVFFTVTQLVEQDLADVRITSVDVTGSFSPTVKAYSITKIEMPKNGVWVKQKGTINVKAGATIQRRLTLTKYGSDASTTRVLKVVVPKAAKGYEGTLAVSNGPNANVGYDEPKTFAALLARIQNAPTYDSIAGSLYLEGDDTIETVTTRAVGAVVLDYYKELPVAVS